MGVLEKAPVDGTTQLVLVLADLSRWLDEFVSEGEALLGGEALDAEDGGITSVIDDLVGAFTVLPSEAVNGEVPVFLKGLFLPGEDDAGACLCDRCGCVVLGGEDVAGAPSDGGSELL